MQGPEKVEVSGAFTSKSFRFFRTSEDLEKNGVFFVHVEVIVLRQPTYCRL